MRIALLILVYVCIYDEKLVPVGFALVFTYVLLSMKIAKATKIQREKMTAKLDQMAFHLSQVEKRLSKMEEVKPSPEESV